MEIIFTNLGALVIILAFVHLIVIFKSLKSTCKSKDVLATLIVSIAMFGSTFVITRDFLVKI